MRPEGGALPYRLRRRTARPGDPERLTKGRSMAKELDENNEADAEPEDPDEVDLEGEADDDSDDDDDDLADDTDDEGDVDEGATVVAPVAATTATAAEEDEEDEEEEPDDEDVEASLDVILKERLVVPEEAEEDEDTAADTDERPEAASKVLPKQPDEFVCQSCFLVKHPTQLADSGRMLCRDCL